MVSAAARRAVFLDRDGVITRAIVRRRKPYAPRRLRDARLMPGAKAAIARLKRAGFLVIVVTNQPDIGNGLVDPAVPAAIHARLRRELRLDDIRMCPHGQSAGCACRKPKPGMLLAAARERGIDLRRSVMVGDRKSDVLAGAAAGCYTVFLDRGYAEAAAQRFLPDAIAHSLPGAAQLILTRLRRGH